MTPLINFVSLGIFTLALAAGQLLFKRVALSIIGQPPAAGLLSLFRHPALYTALAIYGASTLLWIWILSRVPLMQAYPWAAAGVAIVPLIGWYAFGERVAPIFWLGVVLILAGILLTQYGALTE
jgi:multidrug transporter EmrE-like cation transporter